MLWMLWKISPRAETANGKNNNRTRILIAFYVDLSSFFPHSKSTTARSFQCIQSIYIVICVYLSQCLYATTTTTMIKTDQQRLLDNEKEKNKTITFTIQFSLYTASRAHTVYYTHTHTQWLVAKCKQNGKMVREDAWRTAFYKLKLLPFTFPLVLKLVAFFSYSLSLSRDVCWGERIVRMVWFWPLDFGSFFFFRCCCSSCPYRLLFCIIFSVFFARFFFGAAI